MRSAAPPGQPVLRPGLVLSPTEDDRSAVPSSLLSSVDASRWTPSAPSIWQARSDALMLFLSADAFFEHYNRRFQPSCKAARGLPTL